MSKSSPFMLRFDPYCWELLQLIAVFNTCIFFLHVRSSVLFSCRVQPYFQNRINLFKKRYIKIKTVCVQGWIKDKTLFKVWFWHYHWEIYFVLNFLKQHSSFIILKHLAFILIFVLFKDSSVEFWYMYYQHWKFIMKVCMICPMFIRERFVSETSNSKIGGSPYLVFTVVIRKSMQ